MKKILLVSATSFELAGVINFLEEFGTKKSFFEYTFKSDSYFPLVTGIGSMHTAFSISRYCQGKSFDFAFNLGVAGSISKDFQLGQVVQVTHDRLADLGIETADQEFQDVFDLELEKKNNYPFQDGQIQTDLIPGSTLRSASGITVNKSSGSAVTIQQRTNKYKFEIETMEGCGFLYVCKMLDLKAYQLRAISNYVEPRNKENWKLNLALDNLTAEMVEIIKRGFDEYPERKVSLS